MDPGRWRPRGLKVMESGSKESRAVGVVGLVARLVSGGESFGRGGGGISGVPGV